MLAKLRAYRFPLILLFSIIVGSMIGLIFGENAGVLKPFGDVFINLLFMVVVPLVFFSIASAVANMESIRRLGKIMGSMLAIFIVTGILASITMYGLPIQALPIISAIGVVVDPPATMVNSTGDTVSSMLVARHLEGKDWMDAVEVD